MMTKRWSLLLVIVWIVGLLAACATPEATPTPQPVPPTAAAVSPTAQPAAVSPTAQPTVALVENPLYLSIIWHQHQPIYFQDPATGIYQKPWVRVHAAKDYVDMAAILENYPNIRATFNLTPSLLRQLQDLAAGAKDLYQVHTEIPAADLTAEQKAFIQARFFDTNSKIIARFPRYQQIADDRDNSAKWDTQTWLDLQVLFNLAWTDPDWLAQEPLAGLVAKGQNFAEEDKAVVLAEHARLVAEVIPLHQRLQDEGRIEVTMTPFPRSCRCCWIQPGQRRRARHRSPPLCLWLDAGLRDGRPKEIVWRRRQAAGQGSVGIVSSNKAGLQWMANDEELLARSLGEVSLGATARTRPDADALYRPYIVLAATTRCTSSFATRRSVTRSVSPTAAPAAKRLLGTL